ncbi:adhesive plaque matrix protein 2-like [Culicoides brevitarsis]|uniref:adhesive plaque matrix protein 2-like n=1 Tax=Culicoides brevitarsis TaxID=469753 RepID=UPI00307B93B0
MHRCSRNALLLTLVALISVIAFVSACDVKDAHHGCRIDNGQCTCAFGCKSEFRYLSRTECQNALKGRTNDICSQQPCNNGGLCIQISHSPGYKCTCLNGYFGSRCQRKCPTPGTLEYVQGKFSHECVVI